MYYADVDLGGGTYAYKKRFLKIVENAHAYYMPDIGGIGGLGYLEVNADHHVYIRVADTAVLTRIVSTLERRYRFSPDIRQRLATEVVFDRNGRTYAELTYEKRDYVGRDIYPANEDEQDEETV